MDSPKKRRYSEEFKMEAVRRVLDGPVSSNQVSRELGIGQPTLSKWVRRFKLSLPFKNGFVLTYFFTNFYRP